MSRPVIIMSSKDQIYLSLLNKLLQGALSEEERAFLLKITENDDDAKLFLTYLQSGDLSEIDALEAEISFEKTRPTDLVKTVTVIDKINKNKTFWRKYRLIAAVVTVFFTGIYCWYTFKQEMNPKDDWTTAQTGKGERKFFKLVDGTEVWLNNASTLKVRKGYGRDHREMELVGEGYFSVAKNKRLPLRIRTVDADIEVLGTIFNLKSYAEDQSTITSLIEGKVKLQVKGNLNRDYILTPGDRVVVSSKGKLETIVKDQDHKHPIALLIDFKKIDFQKNEGVDLQWVENKLVFNADPLDEMVLKLGRWYNKTIIVENEKLKTQYFSGVFQEKECEKVLELLKETGVHFNYRSQKDTIYIK